MKKIKNKHIVWNTFYNDSVKVYVTTKTITQYNSLGLLILEVVYDPNDREIESRIIYRYEYH